jgi:uracil-DNA glycosylase
LTALAELVADLASCPTPPTLVNPLRDHSADLDRRDAPAIRRSNLVAYLEARPDPVALLVGEAMGWRGGRFSGIAFTSERQLDAWGPPYAASSLREGGWTESSATIIHGVLEETGLEGRVVLWNTVPCHPHPPDRPLANRAPRSPEIALGRPFLDRLVALLRPAQVIAVGRVAERTLDDRATACVRHPAQGGATACRRGLRELLA